MAQKVVLDANALMMPFQFKLNLDAELGRLLGGYEIIVPDCVIRELEGLSNDNRYAKMALALARQKNYAGLATKSGGDDGVLEAAGIIGAMVLTNDKVLRQRVKGAGLAAIILREKSYLAFDE